jgi:hypothetical protein
MTDLREERRQELLRNAGGRVMSQEAPWPEILEELVDRLYYKPGWQFRLTDINRGQGSKGLTLIITITGPDSYHLERNIQVAHYMLVPPACFDRRSWCWWLFQQVMLVEQHEAMEFFRLGRDGWNGQQRPYAPAHGPGNDPYLILQHGTDLDRRTSFTGQVNQ